MRSDLVALLIMIAGSEIEEDVKQVEEKHA